MLPARHDDIRYRLVLLFERCLVTISFSPMQSSEQVVPLRWLSLLYTVVWDIMGRVGYVMRYSENNFLVYTAWLIMRLYCIHFVICLLILNII